MNKLIIVIIILLTTPLNGFGVDIYVPSLPIVQQYFQTTSDLVQLSIGAYLLGFGLIQLISGIICDHIGRRKPYIFGLIIYVIVTISITFVLNIYYLLLLRFIQGVTVGIFVVSCRAIITDLFNGERLKKIANYMSIAWSIGPIIAPMIGAYLQKYFSWHANFYFLAIYGLICVILFIIYVPETMQKDHNNKSQLTFNSVLHTYRIILSNYSFLISTAMLGILYSVAILFNVVAPFLIENVMGYSVVFFGYIALIIGIVWFIGNIINRFTARVDRRLKSKVCFIVIMSSMSFMLLASFFIKNNIYIIIIPYCISFCASGVIFSNYFAHNLSILPSNISASGGAFMGALLIMISAIFGSGFASYLKANSSTILAFGLFTLLTLALILRNLEFKFLK